MKPSNLLFQLRIFILLMFPFVFFLQCSTTKTITIANSTEPFQAELIVKVVKTTPCITLYTSGTCSYQEAYIQMGGMFGTELPYGCLLSNSEIPKASISTNKSESGNKIAYKCSKEDSWHVIYIGSGKRSFLDCKLYPPADTFNWADVPDLLTVGHEMIGRKCGNFLFSELTEEFKHSGGESAVADLLVKTISYNAYRKVSMDNLQAWDDAYLSLSSSAKERLIPIFRKSIMEESTVLALERSVRYLNLDNPEYLPAMIDHMRRIVNSKPHYETDAASEIILQRITKSDPKVGAELACLELEREIKRGAIVYLPTALLAIAYANYPCKAVLKTLENSNCNASYFCPAGQTSHICNANDLKPEIEKALFGNIRQLSIPMRDKALLAAALPLPESQGILQLWQKRQAYTIEQPAEPACEKLYISGKKGVPCNCFKELPGSACGKNYFEVICTYSVDDNLGKINNVVSP